MSKTFAVSGQHYLFTVQAFANAVLAAGGNTYSYALRDRTFEGIVADVQSGASELGVIFRSPFIAKRVDEALDQAGLEFHSLATSAPCVALPAASHPLVHAKSLTIEDLADYPYIYFEQEEGAPIEFAEEAFASIPREKRIACTDRASLSELICALNGYTITSGILVGISDGSLLETIPLETDDKLELGYVSKRDAVLTQIGQYFVSSLARKLERYATK